MKKEPPRRQLLPEHASEVEVGTDYTAKVARVIGMAAFVAFLPGKEGLMHVSHPVNPPPRRPGDVVKVGDEIKVRVIEVDSQGRVNLSAVVLDEPWYPSKVKLREERGGGRAAVKNVLPCVRLRYETAPLS